jgi:hypothetical protein
MSFNYTKENEKYCYVCMAILPTKIIPGILCLTGHCSTDRVVCIKCSNEIKPPEDKNEDNI